MKITMDGQAAYYWFSGSDEFATSLKTVQVKHRGLTIAETALARVSGFGSGLFGGWGSMEIRQTVSDSGVEQFEAPVVIRRNVTSVTIGLVTWNAWIRGRLLLNFWP